MDQPISEKKLRKPRILVVPLDWGLGHVTRCIPIIRELLKQECEVFLAGEGAAETLLRQEFPQLIFLQLKGYRIRYSKRRSGMFWKMIFQLPGIKKAIDYEHQWLKEVVKKYQVDAVISDNRYGLYLKGIYCVFITHQLLIKTFWGGWSEKALQKKNFKYISRFSECWVPDNESENNLAGILSHPRKKPGIPLCYIGLLSRLKKNNISFEKGHLFFLFSGPEPQRTVFEEIVFSQLAYYNGTATVVRGLPGSATIVPSTNTLKFYNHLPAGELGKEMEKAEFIIARSGYSTVMDIVKLQKKSILIPTPGQTEQEYLAHYLSSKKIGLCSDQRNFLLQDVLEKAQSFPYYFPLEAEGKLASSVLKLLKNISDQEV